MDWGYLIFFGLFILVGYGGYHEYLTLHDPSSKYYTFAWVIFIIFMFISACIMGPFAFMAMSQ
jgi:hypothetical protein